MKFDDNDNRTVCFPQCIKKPKQNNNTENSGVHYAMKMDTHATLILMRIKKVNITVLTAIHC